MRKLLILLTLLVCTFAFTSCTQEEKKQPETKPAVVQQKQQTFIVYRAAADGTNVLLPESFTIADNGKSAMENALQYLVSTKPADAKYSDVVPIGTKVLGLKVENGTAYADFSKELAKKGQGSYQENMLCYVIVNTLTEFSEVKRVQILIEGKKVLSLSGHTDIEDPLTRNETMLQPKKK